LVLGMLLSRFEIHSVDEPLVGSHAVGTLRPDAGLRVLIRPRGWQASPSRSLRDTRWTCSDKPFPVAIISSGAFRGPWSTRRHLASFSRPP
jgi:hypothetical protein